LYIVEKYSMYEDGVSRCSNYMELYIFNVEHR